MGTLLILLLPSIVWPFVAKRLWPHQITFWEMVLHLVAGVLITVAAYHGARYLTLEDTAFFNAPLTRKASEQVSCEHSYTCNCRESCSGSGSSRSCSTTCDTCYEHLYDVDWNLYSALGSVKVPRVDRQGTSEPPRYARAAIGDPLTTPYSYQNYIKSAPGSLFSGAADETLKAQYLNFLPEYPSTIHDLHLLNRVLTIGVSLPEYEAWARELQIMLARVGVQSRGNAVLVITSMPNRNYAGALRSHWLGAKHNDLVVVLGVDSQLAPVWADVFGWTEAELVKVELRDALSNMKTLDRAEVLGLLEHALKSGFVPRDPEDFAYLEKEIELDLLWLVGLFILSGAVSFGLSWYFANNGHSNFSGYRTHRPRLLSRRGVGRRF